MEKSATVRVYDIKFEVTLDVYESAHPDDCGEVDLLSICVEGTESNIAELLADNVANIIQIVAEEAISLEEMSAA